MPDKKIVMRLNNKRGYVSGLDKKEIKTIDKNFSFMLAGAQFMKNRKFDGKKHFFSDITCGFPIGLWKRVKKFIEEFIEKDVMVEDNRRYPIDNIPFCDKLHGIELRDYQKEAAEIAILERSGIIECATNAGKTEIVCEVIRELGCSTLIFTNRITLAYQLQERVSLRLQQPVGFIGEGKFSLHQVTICSVKSFIDQNKEEKKKSKVKRHKVKKELENILKKFECLVMDECHYFADAQMRAIAAKAGAVYRFGLSGTPFHNDAVKDHNLIAYFGDVIYKVSNDFLIKRKISSIPIIKYIKAVNACFGMDYRRAVDIGIVANEKRNRQVIKLALNSQKRGFNTIVCVSRIEHGQTLQMMFKKEVLFVFGKDSGKERLNMLRIFNEKKGSILIASTIIDEGIDIKNIDCMILAGGGKKSGRLLQKLGRGLRQSELGKLHVFDFDDQGNKNLKKHSKIRYKTCLSEGFKIKKGKGVLL